MRIEIKIAGYDVSGYINIQSLQITTQINSGAPGNYGSAQFDIEWSRLVADQPTVAEALTPLSWRECIIKDLDLTYPVTSTPYTQVLFAGYTISDEATSDTVSNSNPSQYFWTVAVLPYQTLFDFNEVIGFQTFTAETDLIPVIIEGAYPGFFTYLNLTSGVIYPPFCASLCTLTEILKQVADQTGVTARVTMDKQVIYQEIRTSVMTGEHSGDAYFEFAETGFTRSATASVRPYSDFSLKDDFSTVYNKVMITATDPQLDDSGTPLKTVPGTPITKIITSEQSRANYTEWLPGGGYRSLVLKDANLLNGPAAENYGRQILNRVKAPLQMGSLTTHWGHTLHCGQFVQVRSSMYGGINKAYCVTRIVLTFLGGGIANWQIDLGDRDPRYDDILTQVALLKKKLQTPTDTTTPSVEYISTDPVSSTGNTLPFSKNYASMSPIFNQTDALVGWYNPSGQVGFDAGLDDVPSITSNVVLATNKALLLNVISSGATNLHITGVGIHGGSSRTDGQRYFIFEEMGSNDYTAPPLSRVDSDIFTGSETQTIRHAFDVTLPLSHVYDVGAAIYLRFRAATTTVLRFESLNITAS